MFDFLDARIYRGPALLQGSDDNIWRVWFGADGLPLMERLTAPEVQTVYVEATRNFVATREK